MWLRNTPDYTTLDSWLFDKADKLLAKVLETLETFYQKITKLCGKLASTLESQTTFDERFKATAVP